jgi:membrane protein insertase Oxa1/YidC/SpoIIIJ
MNAEEYQIALDFVKEFYEKAWTWVLGVIGAGFTITGIIFPLVQNHSNSSRIKKLEKRIDEYEKKVNEYRNDPGRLDFICLGQPC